MLGGLLSLSEANAIQSMIILSATQGGDTVLVHDWENVYILNWTDDPFSHHKDILNNVQDTLCLVELPFPTTTNWREAHSNWSIMLDKVIDTTGALERWCRSKWGPGNVGEWGDLQKEKTIHLREVDKLLF